MARLEDLTKGPLVRGVLPDRAIKVVDVVWHGSSAVTLTYTDESTGKPDQELLYRDDDARMSVEQAGRAWSMDADGALFRRLEELDAVAQISPLSPVLSGGALVIPAGLLALAGDPRLAAGEQPAPSPVQEGML